MNWIEQLYEIPTWKKYSQCNEECYVEHILNNLPKVNNTIVELGAWDGFHLSNTRYFIEKYGYEFSKLQTETFDWLKKQDLAITMFPINQLMHI